MSIFALLKTEVHLPKIHWPKEHWLMLVLCYIAFRLVATSGQGSFLNASLAMDNEVLFIIFYFLILRETPDFINIVKDNALVSALLLLWSISITISLLYSPLDLGSKYYAQQRYLQTILHIVFFIFIWDFFYRYRPPLRWLFYTIAASTMYVMFIFATEILVNPEITNMSFSRKPPLNSHIRHTGYQAGAALCFFFAFYIKDIKFGVKNVAHFVILTALWAFIFWLGGRGTALSILCTVVLLSVLLKWKGDNFLRFLAYVLLAVVIGMALSELFVYFSWNGLSYSVNRTIGATTLNKLSTGRIDIWIAVWNSVKDHLIMGLGSQSFYYMPTRVTGHVQAHNMFMQFLVEWGLLGSFLFLSLLIRGAWSGFKSHVLNKKYEVNEFAFAAGAVICMLTVNGLIDGTYYHPQPSIYLAIAFAIWIIPPLKEKPNIVKGSSS